MEIPNKKTGDHIVVDWAIEEINKKRSEPAFIAVGLFPTPYSLGSSQRVVYNIHLIRLPYRNTSKTISTTHTAIKEKVMKVGLLITSNGNT